jgi:hypothetical protein
MTRRVIHVISECKRFPLFPQEPTFRCSTISVIKGQSEEIRATHAQGLGDTVLLEGPNGIAAFAVCHYGPRSEAGAGACFIKFAAVRAGASAEQDYLRLLDACETFALTVKMPSLLAGANMARHEAYRHLVARGFRTEIQGVTMHRHNDPGYCRPGVYIIDDWQQHSVGSLPIREWLRASFSLPCGGIIETRHPRFCGKSRPAGVLLVQFVGDAFVVEAIETFLSDLLV